MTRPRVVIVGGESLLGKEVRGVLSGSGLDVRLRMLGSGEEAVLTEEKGEASVMIPLEESELGEAGLVFLAGTSGSGRKLWELAARKSPRPGVIDLTYGLEGRAEAQIRAPQVEPPGWPADPAAIHVVAHPAAIALALLLRRLAERHRLRRSVAVVFEPASERGRRGIDELQKQTVQLFSFQTLPQEVFDAQLSFNLLPRYGTEAPEPLDAAELRIDRHLATLLDRLGGIPMPSLRLVQAPVFHGHSFSLWAEFEHNPGPEALAESLAGPGFDVRTRTHEPPTNVGAAGQSGVTVEAIETDRNHRQAAWLWMVADNHRLAAENAVDVARQLLGAEAAR